MLHRKTFACRINYADNSIVSCSEECTRIALFFHIAPFLFLLLFLLLPSFYLHWLLHCGKVRAGGISSLWWVLVSALLYVFAHIFNELCVNCEQKQRQPIIPRSTLEWCSASNAEMSTEPQKEQAQQWTVSKMRKTDNHGIVQRRSNRTWYTLVLDGNVKVIQKGEEMIRGNIHGKAFIIWRITLRARKCVCVCMDCSFIRLLSLKPAYVIFWHYFATI